MATTQDGARQNFEAGHKGRFFLDPDLLREVEVVRGSNPALHGSGAIVGPNGAGKTTLPAAMAGDLKPAGEVRLDDRSLIAGRRSISPAAGR